MSYTFETDPANVLEFYPSELINKTNMIKASYKTYSGKNYSYKKGVYASLEFVLDFVSASDAETINEWWRSGAVLNTTINGMEYNVKIMGRSQPLDKHQAPYVDYYKGNLLLETIDNTGFTYLLGKSDDTVYLLGSDGVYLAVQG